MSSFSLTFRWIPRMLCIAFILFIGLFSLDVFSETSGFWKIVAGFLIHNIPTIILIVVLILSWRWPWIGGICFIALGFAYLLWLAPQRTYPIIYYPLFALGLLFIIDWILRKRVKNHGSNIT